MEDLIRSIHRKSVEVTAEITRNHGSQASRLHEKSGRVVTSKALTYCWCFVLSSICLTNSAQGERFFEKHSTWYEKIPANPELDPDSEKIVDHMSSIRGSFGYNYRQWAKGVFFADSDDPRVTVNIEPCNTKNIEKCDRIEFHGWNLNVPMPSEVEAPGAADGALTIMGPDGKYSWDMRRFVRDPVTGEITVDRIKRHDLSGDGVYQPWPGNDYTTKVESPFHGNVSVSPVPKIHGIVLYDDVKSGYIDHALYLGYGGTKGDQFSLPKPPNTYPCNTQGYTYGWADDPYSPQLGHRFQLDPTLDVNNPSHWGGELSKGEKVVAKAMQEYGIIFIENSGPNNINVVFESLDWDQSRDWFDTPVRIDGAGRIPISSLRLIKPLLPPFDVVPAAPKMLRVE